MNNKKTLTIGFDAKRALLNRTGLGNYSRRVIEQIAELHPEWTLKLFSPRKGEIEVVEGDIVLPDSWLWKKLSSVWRVNRGLSSALVREGVDLYHGLSNELPLDILRTGVPSVVTMHDVIYRRYPDNYSSIDRKIYDYKYGRSARNATRVIAISECTKRDVMEFYGVEPENIDVIYQSTHPQFAEPVSADMLDFVRKHYDLPERFIAMVGTVEPRKNQMLAVEALPFIEPEVKLIIVGRSRQGYGEKIMACAQRLGVENRVLMLDSVPFNQLPAIYKLAEVAAYVSRYEGYGLPVVEALQAGSPVIAATGSCLEEAGGPGAVYVHPDDVKGFADAANKLLESEQLRDEMVEAGRRHVAKNLSVPMEKAVEQTYFKALEQAL